MRFLEVSLDLDNSMLDYELGQDERVRYVFDAHILKILIHLSSDPRNLAGFHAPEWARLLDSPTSETEEAHQQAVALTAEYILQLNQSLRRDVIITRNHYHELMNEVADVGFRTSEKIAQLGTSKFRDEILARRNAIKEKKSHVNTEIEDRGFELGDIYNDNSDERLMNYRVNRAAICKTEPLDIAVQINRLTGAEFRSRIKIADDLAYEHPINRKALNDFTNEWNEWIHEECKFKSIPVRKDLDDETDTLDELPELPREKGKRGLKGRSSGGIWSDAVSLGLIEALNSLGIMEDGKRLRFVFVTSDQVLFDAYRRHKKARFQKSPDKRSRLEVRRFSQFTVDLLWRRYHQSRGDNDLGVQLRRVSEFSALPMSVLAPSEFAAYSRGPTLREERAIEYNDLKYNRKRLIDERSFRYLAARVVRDMQNDKDYMHRFSNLLSDWRSLEATAITYSEHFLNDRLNSYIGSFSEFPDDSTKNDEKWIEIFEATRRRLELETVNAFEPLASSSIKEFYHKNRPKEHERIPILVQVGAKNPKAAVRNIESGVRAPLDVMKLDSVFSREFQIFFQASIVCLYQGRWRDSHKFVRLAKRLVPKDLSSAVRHKRIELQYLENLCSRFKLQRNLPALTQDDFEEVKQTLNEVPAKHDNIIESVRQDLKLRDRDLQPLPYTTDGLPKWSIRIARSLSEKATLLLTLSQNWNFSFRTSVRENLNQKHEVEGISVNLNSEQCDDSYVDIIGRTVLEFDRAWKYLFETDWEFGSVTGDSRFFLDRVISQTALNYTALLVVLEISRFERLRFRLAKNGYDVEHRSLAIKRLKDFWKVDTNKQRAEISAISQLELALFCKLFDMDIDFKFDESRIKDVGSANKFDQKYGSFLLSKL